MTAIRTARTSTEVPFEKYAELCERLERAGLDEAALHLRTSRAFPEETKGAVLGLLNDWFDEVKIEAFGPELVELRHELDWDLGNR